MSTSYQHMQNIAKAGRRESLFRGRMEERLFNSIRELDLEGGTKVDSRIEEISEISNSIESLRVGLQAFKTYVPAGLVKDLITTGETARIGGKNEILTIFFCDIEDFTNISHL